VLAASVIAAAIGALVLLRAPAPETDSPGSSDEAEETAEMAPATGTDQGR